MPITSSDPLILTVSFESPIVRVPIFAFNLLFKLAKETSTSVEEIVIPPAELEMDIFVPAVKFALTHLFEVLLYINKSPLPREDIDVSSSSEIVSVLFKMSTPSQYRFPLRL